MKLPRKREKRESGFTAALCVLATFCFVSLCWVFFRAGDFATAMKVFRAIFTWQQGLVHISSWALFGLGCLALGELAAIIRSRKRGLPAEGFYPLVRLDTISGLTVFFVFTGLTLGLAYTGENPFIYFQF